MRISLLQSLSVDTSRMETTDPIWLIGSTFQSRRIPSFFRENHFPFFASGPRNAGKEASSQRAPFFPFLSSLSSYSARVPGHFPAHLRASYEESSHNGGGAGDSDTNFRRSAAPPSLISNTQFEKRGISAAKFSTSCASLIFHTSPHVGDVNEDRDGISHGYRYEGFMII